MTDLKAEFAEMHARVCRGLSDPKRLLILNALREGELSVKEICQTLELTQANASQHLAILRDRNLVTARREGQRVFYSITSPKLIEAMDLLRDMLKEQNLAPLGGS